MVVTCSDAMVVTSQFYPENYRVMLVTTLNIEFTCLINYHYIVIFHASVELFIIKRFTYTSLLSQKEKGAINQPG